MEELVNRENTVITYTDYRKYKEDLDAELQKSAESFVKIGYLLKVARDTGILQESGYANVNEFAQKEYGLDKTQVSRFMNINDRFSEEGYSEKLRGEYKGYGYAKLSIMLLLPEEVNEMLTTDLSKTEIQAVREEIAEEQKVTDIEIMLDGQEEAQQEMGNLEKALHQLGHDEPELYTELYCAMGDGIEAVKEALMPAGYKMYSVRPRGVGRIMLSVSEEKGVHLLVIREDSKEEYTWEQMMESLQGIMLPERTVKESWEEIYDEEMPQKEEVAPVQQQKTHVRETKVVKAKVPEPPKPQVTEQKEEQEQQLPEQKEENAQQSEVEKSEENVEESITQHEVDIVEPVDADAGAPLVEEKQVSDIDTEDGTGSIEERRSRKIEELEKKVKFWEDACETNQIVLKNRISMRHWDVAHKTALEIADEIEKIQDINREIEELRENIQMNIIDMEEQEEEDAQEDREESEIPV